MRKSLVIGVTLATALTTSACADNAPKCSDPETIRTLKELLVENNVLNANFLVGIKGENTKLPMYDIAKTVDNYNVISITTDKQLENKQGYSCSATAELSATKENSNEFAKIIKRLASGDGADEYSLNLDKGRVIEITKAIINNPSKIVILTEPNNERTGLMFRPYIRSSRNIKYTVQLTDDGKRLVSARW